MSLVAALMDGDTFAAASPNTSTARTRAKSNIKSASRSPRSRPATKCETASAASIMWRMRVRSSGCILHLGSAQHLFPKILAQVLRRAQVDLAAPNELGQLELDSCEAEQAGLFARDKLDEQVHVAVRPGGALQDGTEQREPTNVVAPAQRSQRIGVEGQPSGH